MEKFKEATPKKQALKKNKYKAKNIEAENLQWKS